VNQLKQGDYFEERVLFFNEYHSFNAVAVGDVSLYSLDKNDFASLVEPNLRRFLYTRMKD